jgi:hypothetical protein
VHLGSVSRADPGGGRFREGRFVSSECRLRSGRVKHSGVAEITSSAGLPQRPCSLLRRSSGGERVSVHGSVDGFIESNVYGSERARGFVWGFV